MALKLTYDVLQYAAPMLLNAIVQFLTDIVASQQEGGGERPPNYLGFVYVAALFVLAVVQTAMLHQYFFAVFQLGMHLRSAVTLTVYTKALRLSSAAPERTAGVGTITNLMSTDGNRLQNLSTYVMTIVSGPWQIALAITLLWFQLGPSVFAGLAVMVVAIPLNVRRGALTSSAHPLPTRHSRSSLCAGADGAQEPGAAGGADGRA